MKSRILVVDDTVDVANLFQAILSRCEDYDVDVAYGGEDALKLYATARSEERPYDLIIMDLAMPFMNGFEVEQRVYGAGDNTTKIAFLSAHDDPMDAHRADFSRVVARWQKPIESNELRRLVAEAIKSSGTLTS